MAEVNTGALIKRWRVLMGLTQQALADKIGVTRYAVYAWERGLRRPELVYAKRLAKILNLNVNDLISEKEKKKLIFEIQEGF